MVHIYNSLTRKNEAFTPIVPGKVRLYVCGMTVYDYCHLGHARVMVVFDMVARYLRARGFATTYIRNITDIDDKIIKRARENDESIDALTARFIQAMNEDAAALGVLPPDSEPRATAYMPQILDMIGKLVERGFAYQAKNNDVYYRVRKFPSYGALSGKTLDELKIGARVEVGEDKDDPLDFVLWKSAKPGEPQWDSSWGAGRPGWHIECSAMSTACLGNHFDIHGGGMDLKFPHHENEIAQSEASTGEKFANAWMHVGFVRLNEEKMSKSLGNFFTVREVLKKFDPEVVRYFILGSHYRSPLDYSDENLQGAKEALTRLNLALNELPAAARETPGAAAYEERFYAAMDDDFNTPGAMAVLFELARDINRLREQSLAAAAPLGATLRRLGGILGLLQRPPRVFLRGGASDGLTDVQIEDLIGRRKQARQHKNWAESDRIRDELNAQGVILEDQGGQTTWRRR
ncbi:MAG: cysteine--tRNA ligase [Sulfuricaulis sp.]